MEPPLQLLNFLLSRRAGPSSGLALAKEFPTAFNKTKDLIRTAEKVWTRAS
jgi:hypothetical protein